MNPISKFALSQAVAEVVCPKCGAQIGELCVKPSGRKALTTHVERATAYRQLIGDIEFRRRHTITAQKSPL